ncbi:MAG: DUF63 family protein [Candidatus Micrarchaeota archaeon]|nr:DUF63 family protein [Candidatus Micrarchaeota archaeon]
MDIGAFINEHYISPIIMHEGYNPVNTLTYAIIAVICAFLIYKWLKREGIAVDRQFMLRILPFILLGSTLRVITDSIHSGAMQAYDGLMKPVYGIVLASHIYDYGFLTVTPGIYVVVGLFTIALIWISHRLRKPDLALAVAWVLFAVHFLMLVPLFANFAYAALILAIAGAIAGAYYTLKRNSNVPLHYLVVFSQALDGAATFVTLDIFNRAVGNMYVEQHVFANSLYALVGGTMLPFLVIKALLPIAIIHFLEKENDSDERGYIALLVIIFGLAPGVRDLLRLLAGT